jgi:hypothetical protein
MVCFQTKNPNLGKFWRAMENLGIFYDHLEYFLNIGIMSKEKSGNPAFYRLGRVKKSFEIFGRLVSSVARF